MFTPIILLFQQSELERISLGGATTIQVADLNWFITKEEWQIMTLYQTYLGLAWVCGVVTFGMVSSKQF